MTHDDEVALPYVPALAAELLAEVRAEWLAWLLGRGSVPEAPELPARPANARPGAPADPQEPFYDDELADIGR